MHLFLKKKKKTVILTNCEKNCLMRFIYIYIYIGLDSNYTLCNSKQCYITQYFLIGCEY